MPAREARVVDADIGIFDRRRRLERAAQRAARRRRRSGRPEAHHVGDVLVGAGQPVLQRQEIGAHVLRGAGDEAQELAAAAAASSSALAAGARAAGACRAAASAGDGAAGARRPCRTGRAGSACTTSAADMQQTIASQSFAARLQRRQDGADMILQEQHGGDDDVAAGDVGAAARPAPRRSSPHSSAACSVRFRPGRSRRSSACARAAAPARWLSIVTMTTRIGVASAAEMRFGIVQGLDGDRWRCRVRGEASRCCGAPCRGRRTESSAVPSRPRRPGRVRRHQRRSGSDGDRGGRSPATGLAPRCDGAASSWNSKSSRNIASRCSSRPIISGWTQVSKMTLAPSKPICGE